MQNAKDSFYIALRNRLMVLNPLRTVVVRAVQRPGILLEEAEAPTEDVLNDAFTLRWTSLSVTEGSPTKLSAIGCEIRYATSGSQAIAGLDRGRALSEMDRELSRILRPLRTQKLDYSTTPAKVLQTEVFWTEPTFGSLTSHLNQLARVSTVKVFSFLEPEEL